MLAVRIRRAAAALVAAGLIVGCSVGEPEPDDAPPSTTTSTAIDPTTTAQPPTTTTVALPEPVPVAWEPCGDGFDCARVTVPVDYQQPEGPVLEVALIRRPAGDPAQRIGTLITNPGGPGASGVRRVRRGLTVSPEVAARFDIVGFDPRGIGDSTPISCGSAVPRFRAADLAPDSPAEEASLAAAAQAVADECAATEGLRLGHLGTQEVAHDVEVIRRAIGEPHVSFLGLSYGTLIGLLWADAYPSSVRAMVLDGVVDPAAQGDLAAGSAQVDSVDAALDAIERACTADPGCPLAADGGVLAAYDELARRIEAGAVVRAGVGPTQLAYAAFAATYGPERWAPLWTALSDGLAGDLSGVATLSDWFTGLVSYAPFALVTCLDSAHPEGFEAWQDAADRADRRSPRFGRVLANELLPCAWWPQGSFEPRTVTAEGTPPVLVVGSTGDAATPYEQAQRVARTLDDGVLLTVDLDGHIALNDSDCADEAITRYLVDLATPPPGHRC